MPHVDDGTIHAWLDGAIDALAEAGALPDGASAADIEAHFRACADCRARLETEREIRARAGMVLTHARPTTLDVPPFEHLLRQQSPPRRRSSMVPVAWAASVVLALGAGWMGSELLRREPSAAELSHAREPADAARSGSAEPQVAAAPTADGAADAAGAAAAADGAVAAADGSAAGGTTATAPSAGTVAQAVASPGRAETAAAAALASAERAALAREAATGERAPAAAPAAAPPPADRSAAVTQPPQVQLNELVVTGVAPPTANRLSQAAPGNARISGQAAAAALPPAPSVTVMAPASPDAAAKAAADVQQQADAFTALRQRVRAERVVWLSLSADDQRRSGTPVLAVRDGAEGVIRVESPVALPASLVRVRQTLATGEPIEILLWRAPGERADSVIVAGAPLRPPEVRARAAAAEPDAQRTRFAEVGAGALADGARELILHEPGSDVWVAITGPVPVDRLRLLAAQLGPLY